MDGRPQLFVSALSTAASIARDRHPIFFTSHPIANSARIEDSTFAKNLFLVSSSVMRPSRKHPHSWPSWRIDSTVERSAAADSSPPKALAMSTATNTSASMFGFFPIGTRARPTQLGAVRNSGSDSDSRNATTASISSSVASKPRTRPDLSGLVRPSPANGPSSIKRPPAA